MGDTSSNSPFVANNRLSAVHDDHATAGLNQHPMRIFRQWRPAPAQPSRLLTTHRSDTDPYLFVLLADQELEAQRPEQAESLIEAAYAAYDQCRLGS